MKLTDLHKPFPPSEIEWRVGSTNGAKDSGLALAYLTARHIMERLDEVCGPDKWQTRYEFHGSRTICYLSIKIGDEWVVKADGAGDSDVEAEKGAISDALKRAAVSWGIGRYLYSMNNVWVDIEPAGKSYRIKRDQYAKLEMALARQFGVVTSPVTTMLSEVVAIIAATPLDRLQDVFGEAWRAFPYADDRAALKTAYEARKKFLALPVSKAANFDNLEPPSTNGHPDL